MVSESNVPAAGDAAPSDIKSKPKAKAPKPVSKDTGAKEFPAEVSGRVSKIAYAAAQNGEAQLIVTVVGKKAKHEQFEVGKQQKMDSQVIANLLVAACAAEAKVKLKLQYGEGGSRQIAGVEVKPHR